MSPYPVKTSFKDDKKHSQVKGEQKTKQILASRSTWKEGLNYILKQKEDWKSEPWTSGMRKEQAKQRRFSTNKTSSSSVFSKSRLRT